MSDETRIDPPHVANGVVASTHDIPLIAEHDSWITVDPLLGCPASCGYCYLGPLGLRSVKPTARATPAALAQALVDYLYGRRSLIVDPLNDRTPICIGNYTDMLLSRSNRDRLVAYLKEITGTGLPPRPMVVVTKGAIDQAIVRDIDALGWPVYWCFSQSMALASQKYIEAGKLADLDTTLANAKHIAGSQNQQAIHFWRPFVPELRQPRNAIPRLLGRLSGAGFRCSVVIGLKRGPGVPLDDPRLVSNLGRSLAMSGSSEVFDHDGWNDLRGAAGDIGYAVYRNTSCALALLGRTRESLGTWLSGNAADFCLPCSCPGRQRARCTVVTEGLANKVSAVAAFLRISPDEIEHDVKRRTLSIASSISEHDYNVLAHGLGPSLRIRPVGVVRQKAWLGRFVERLGHDDSHRRVLD